MSLMMKCKTDCCGDESTSSSSISSQSSSSVSSSSSSEVYCLECDDGSGGPIAGDDLPPGNGIDNSVFKIRVDIAGLVSGSSCNCSPLNGTYILTGSACAWSYTFPVPVTCNNGVRDVVFDRILAQVVRPGPPGTGTFRALRVQIVEANWPVIMPPALGGSYAVTWVKVYDWPPGPPCNRWNNEAVPPNSPAFGTAPATLCRHDGTATCHVTSIPTP